MQERQPMKRGLEKREKEGREENRRIE